MSVMIVEDDVQLGRALLLSMERAGMEVQWLRRVTDARSMLMTRSYSAIVLDVELLDGTGYDVLSWMRERSDQTPVLFASVRESVSERVHALESGADDYLTKPFAVDELISRVRALIRRSLGHGSPLRQLGPITIDLARQQVSVNHQPCELSPREFAVLLELVKSAGQVVSRQNLEDAIFRSPEHIESNALEVHIHKLRRKLGGDLIQTVRGVGYRVNVNA